MPIIDTYKRAAERLTAYLSEKHKIRLKHASALEVVAKVHGARDWNTLAAAPAQSGRTPVAGFNPFAPNLSPNVYFDGPPEAVEGPFYEAAYHMSTSGFPGLMLVERGVFWSDIGDLVDEHVISVDLSDRFPEVGEPTVALNLLGGLTEQEVVSMLLALLPRTLASTANQALSEALTGIISRLIAEEGECPLELVLKELTEGKAPELLNVLHQREYRELTSIIDYLVTDYCHLFDPEAIPVIDLLPYKLVEVISERGSAARRLWLALAHIASERHLLRKFHIGIQALTDEDGEAVGPLLVAPDVVLALNCVRTKPALTPITEVLHYCGAIYQYDEEVLDWKSGPSAHNLLHA